MKTTRTKTIHKRINTGHLIVHLALLAGIVVVAFPFLWMLLTSLLSCQVVNSVFSHVRGNTL